MTTIVFAWATDLRGDTAARWLMITSMRAPSLYVGLISTVGSTEVSALGDDVNDGARIEPCATGGRLLA